MMLCPGENCGEALPADLEKGCLCGACRACGDRSQLLVKARCNTDYRWWKRKGRDRTELERVRGNSHGERKRQVADAREIVDTRIVQWQARVVAEHARFASLCGPVRTRYLTNAP
jgi:hypothetical protein